MLTPMSITSLDQGRDLAIWHIGRFYADGPVLFGEPGYPQTIAEQATPVEQGPRAERRSVRSVWAAAQRRLRSAFGRNVKARGTA